jgi:hypothetical protein
MSSDRLRGAFAAASIGISRRCEPALLQTRSIHPPAAGTDRSVGLLSREVREVRDKEDAMRMEKEKARQAETSGVVRYVLGASLVAIVVAMALIWFYYAG